MSTSPQAFNDRITTLKTGLVEQGRRVQTLLEAAFDAVFSRDPAQAARVAALDDEVDRIDVQIEQSAVQLLTDATREGAQLTPNQLRAVLTIVKINNELERIADAGVDVSELVEPLQGLGSPFPDTFRVIANSVIGILRDVNSAVLRHDPVMAKVVLQSQHAVAAFKDAIVRAAEEKIAGGQMGVDFAFTLHEIAGQCVLIADHCTNIAEQIIYLTTGSIVRHMPAQWVEVAKTAGPD